MIKYLLLIIILILIILYLNNNLKKETFKNLKNAFCLLVKKPNIIWLNFLETMVNDYDIFICVDIQDNYTELKNKYNNIKFIEIDDDICNKSNYINSSYLFKSIIASDRAFYYFNHINNNYNYIWYCEDDVYFNNVSIIKILDAKYPYADILSNNVTINLNGNLTTWQHWHSINNLLPLPWAAGSICLFRVSNNLMKLLDDFIIKNQKMIFIETQFHTLAIHNGMIIETPSEMSKILCCHNWSNDDIINDINNNKYYIYHPIKNIEKHLELRNNNYTNMLFN